MRIVLLLALVAASIVFWDSIVLYPVKLFVVLLHEASHGLAAVVTGGSINGIEISEMIGGSCKTEGGAAAVIASSGYVGSMVFGSFIFLVSLRHRLAQGLAYVIALGVTVLTLAFIDNTFGVVFGLGFSLALVLMATFLPDWMLGIVLQVMGAVSCLYALVDIKEDLFTEGARVTDATILSGMTGVPALFWSGLWALFAVIVFFVMIRLAYRELS
jgi:hypothetical protein